MSGEASHALVFPSAWASAWRQVLFGLIGIAGIVGAGIGFGFVSLQFVLVIAFVGLLLGALQLARREKVEVFQNALVYTSAFGKKQYLRWDEVQDVSVNTTRVQKGLLSSSYGEVRFARHGAPAFVLTDSIQDISTLANLVWKTIAPYKAQHVVHTLRQGRAIAIDSLMFHPQGLQLKQHLVPWSSIERVEANESAIRLHLLPHGTTPVDFPRSWFRLPSIIEQVALAARA